jgi:hypothetical protein
MAAYVLQRGQHGPFPWRPCAPLWCPRKPHWPTPVQGGRTPGPQGVGRDLSVTFHGGIVCALFGGHQTINLTLGIVQCGQGARFRIGGQFSAAVRSFLGFDGLPKLPAQILIGRPQGPVLQEALAVAFRMAEAGGFDK